MKVSITFNSASTGPHKHNGGGTNYHTIPCQGVCYISSRNVVEVSFSEIDISQDSVKTVIANRHIGTFWDSGHKWVEIPLSEVQYFTVRTEMR